MPSLLRRFSSRLRSKDRDGQEKPAQRKSGRIGPSVVNGKPQADGWPLANGIPENERDESHGDAIKFDKSNGVAITGYPDPPDHGNDRVDIAKALDSLGNLISHSMKPMPEEHGDSPYEKNDPHPSFFKELKSLNIHNVQTLKEKLEVGKDPIDDKTMLVGDPGALLDVIAD